MESQLAVVVPELYAAEGGISMFSRMFIEAIDRVMGRKVEVISRNDRRSDFPRQFLRGRVVRCAGGFPKQLRPAILFGACAVSRADVYFSTHTNFLPALYLISRVRKIRYSSVAHGIEVWGPQRRLKRAALAQAERFLAVSQFTSSRLINSHGIDPKRVFVFPNTVDEKRFDLKGERTVDLKEKYGIRVGEKVILTIARLSAREGYKGYDSILYVLNEVQECCGPTRYIIVGRGDDAERISRLSVTLGVEDRVILAGFVPEEMLAAHYRMADVFAMPSTGEGFGIVFLEAMACGVPVLGGNRDGTVDALANGRLGQLVDPLNNQEICAGLVRVLSREGPVWWYQPKELRRQMLERFGREHFEQRLRCVLGGGIAVGE